MIHNTFVVDLLLLCMIDSQSPHPTMHLIRVNLCGFVWICMDLDGFAMGLLWICIEFVWVCCGLVIVSWVCSAFVVDLLRICMDLLWIC
jgi:hypothetical protein